MFCTTGALSLNNSSQNCHHLQTLHSSCWQTFFFHLPISLRNPTTVLSGFSAEFRDTRSSTTPKRTRKALESSIVSSTLARPEAFSHSKKFTHLFPRATPPLVSTDDPPTLPPTLPSTFPHRPLLYQLTPPLPTSPPPILPHSPHKLSFPTPTTLCESSIALSTFATRGNRASPRQYLSSSTASSQDPCRHLNPVRNCLFSFLQLGRGYHSADNPRHI